MNFLSVLGSFAVMSGRGISCCSRNNPSVDLLWSYRITGRLFLASFQEGSCNPGFPFSFLILRTLRGHQMRIKRYLPTNHQTVFLLLVQCFVILITSDSALQYHALYLSPVWQRIRSNTWVVKALPEILSRYVKPMITGDASAWQGGRTLNFCGNVFIICSCWQSSNAVVLFIFSTPVRTVIAQQCMVFVTLQYPWSTVSMRQNHLWTYVLWNIVLQAVLLR